MTTFHEIINLTIEHLFMVLTSVLLATIIAVPLAILIYKKNFHVNFFVNFFSLFQSFPSLGLFAILVPFIGIGMKTVVFSLFLYALMPIFINTINGFKSVNPEYYTIIEALNISQKKILLTIELPNVLPQIINGIRLATIYSLSIATIGTLVGAGGLGDLIYLGLQQMSIITTIYGIIPLLILTIIINYLFNKLEYNLLPADLKNMQKEKK